MERRRILRILRIAVSVVSLTACVLLIALWVRSYYWTDFVSGSVYDVRAIDSNSHRGRVAISLRGHPPDLPWKLHSYPTDQLSGFLGRSKWQMGINGSEYWFVVIPHWLLVLIAAILAAVPWANRIRWRFSLRTLLIATMLVAIVLGVIAISV